MKPHALVTNDDGIESAFLHRLVEALLPDFQVSVAAPAFEQSDRPVQSAVDARLKSFKVRAFFLLSGAAWAISGTLTDCVNIALGNLLPELNGHRHLRHQYWLQHHGNADPVLRNGRRRN